MASTTESTNIFYIKAGPAKEDPTRARCNFYKDFACKKRVKPPLRIPKDAGEAIFVQVPAEPNWLLVGAVADRVDTTVIDPSFLPATFNQVAVPMPRSEVVTQGVLLIFSSQGPTRQLYSSADPIVENDGG